MKLFDGLKSDDKNPEKRRLHKLIQSQAWIITKKFVTKRLSMSEVNKLQRMYDDYYKKFPNPEEQMRCNAQIIKLRNII